MFSAIISYFILRAILYVIHEQIEMGYQTGH